MRVVTRRRLREYAALYPDAGPALDRWERIVTWARWRTPHDVKGTFGNVDRVIVGSGNTVYVFHIQGNAHRLVAAIHLDRSTVFVLRSHAALGILPGNDG